MFIFLIFKSFNKNLPEHQYFNGNNRSVSLVMEITMFSLDLHTVNDGNITSVQQYNKLIEQLLQHLRWDAGSYINNRLLTGESSMSVLKLGFSIGFPSQSKL